VNSSFEGNESLTVSELFQVPKCFRLRGRTEPG